MKRTAISFLILILSISYLFSENALFHSQAMYKIIRNFGPELDGQEEWYLSKGVVFETGTDAKVLSPWKGKIIAIETENLFTPDYFIDQDLSMVVIHFDNQKTGIFYNLQLDDQYVGDELNSNQLIGTVGYNESEENFSFQMNLIIGDYRSFLLPDIFQEEPQEISSPQLLDPLEHI